MSSLLITKDEPKSSAPITSISSLYGPWMSYVLTKSTSLIGGLELAGKDPRTIAPEELSHHAALLRAAYQLLPVNAIVTQYYMHFDNVKIELANRADKRSNLLSKRREKFLNEDRSLSGSRLFHLIDLPPKSNLNKLNGLHFMGQLCNAAVSKKSRDYLKTRMSTRDAIYAGYENLAEQVQRLDSEISQLRARFGILNDDNRQLNIRELWALMRVLHTLNPDYFIESTKEPVPQARWDLMLTDGDIEHVTINRVDYLRFNGIKTRYARIASVIGYGENEVKEGFWVNGTKPPVMLPGNYMIMTRWRAMSDAQRKLMFFNRRTDLERSQVKISDIVKGNDDKSAIEEEFSTSHVKKREIAELDEAQSLPDRFGYYCSQILLFDNDPTALLKACERMNSAVTQAGGQLVWEKRGISHAFESFLPSYKKNYLRDVIFTTSQFAAASHLYRSSEGVKTWGPQNNLEEAWYIFESEDGTPFHFTPYIGGRMVIIGVGPIRSGKTFTKNCIATHFQKFGGYFRAIDIDPGAEPIAEFFGDQAGSFRVEDGSTRGLNFFAGAKGADDKIFASHALSQFNLMLSANENPEMRTLDKHEQEDVDGALIKTLRLPRHMQSLTTFHKHLGKSTQRKFDRWVGEGIYAYLFDNQDDAIGDLKVKIGTFNLAGCKDDPIAMPLLQNEIFYRTTRQFEDPAQRHLPKFLDCDEAHFLLGIKSASNKLIKNVRTWGKWNAGVGLWTQSANELEKLQDWAALRSAASTFFFMADPALDRELYRRTFLLTEGELNAIANLIPKRQALIVQKEAGISKVVNMFVEPEQYVINTSVAHEAEIRRQMMREHGDPDIAIERTIDLLGIRKPKTNKE